MAAGCVWILILVQRRYLIAGGGSHLVAVHPNPGDISRGGASDQLFEDPWPVVKLGPYTSGTVGADVHSYGVEHETLGKDSNRESQEFRPSSGSSPERCRYVYA